MIVAAGRLADAKNYPLLIDALALLRQRVPARLFILGQGDRGAAAARAGRRAAARGRRGDLCGFQRNPWKYIARADVFALSSRYEGFGNVLVEAMACGVPVVATAFAGTRDIVRDGVDGLLVERHEPAAVAAALDARARATSRPARPAGRRGAPERGALRAAGRRRRAYDRVFREVLA